MTRLRPMSILLIAAVAAPAPMMAQAPDELAKTGNQADANQVVCKKQAETGSRFQKKTCRTRAQWEAIRIQNQRDLKELQDRPQIETSRG